MADKVNVMPQSLSNLIAAGEVVERPASALKELVENSIDALSTHIYVQIINGGLKSLIVKDDGTGMNRHDATFSILRHASSKIKTAFDLNEIMTMGFRGEALPSIISVSEFKMETSDGIEGTIIEASGENKPTIADGPLRKGTTITINNLFYNTPARLKYMKSEQYEKSRCIDVMERLALGFPFISFDVKGDDGKTIFTTSGRNDVIEVIQRIWGNDIAKRINKSTVKDDVDFSMDLYLANPEINYSNKYQIMTFLNNRFIYSFKLNKAIEDAYRDHLSPLRYPFAVVKIDIEPELVDVNVHPSKKEVRISCEDKIANAIKKSIHEFLTIKKPIYTEKQSEYILNKPNSLFEDNNLFNKELKKDEVDINKLGGNKFSPKPQSNNPLFEGVERVSFQGNDIREIEKNLEHIEKINKENFDKNNNQVYINNPYNDLIPIGQIAKTYIICDSPYGLAIIDQHAAAERINFEKFSKLFNEQIKLISPLEPMIIELPPSMVLSFDESKKKFLEEHYGLVVEMFGNNALKLMSIPEFLTDKNYEGVLKDIIVGSLDNKKEEPEALMRKAISTIACKASVRAGQILSPMEQVSLIKELGKCKNPANCPHGRPTVIKITIKELEHMFKRTGF